MEKQTMSSIVYIKNKKRLRNEFQFHRHDFVEVACDCGIPLKKDFVASYKYHIRALIRAILLLIYKVQKKFGLLPVRKKKLLVTANGGTVDDNIFPYYWGYEIIPVVWDCWLDVYPRLKESIKLHNIKIVFTTSSIIADKLRQDLNIDAHWIYEGIKQGVYKKGSILSERPYDVIELGRRHKVYHKILLKCIDKGLKLTASDVRENGVLDENKLMYKDQKDIAMNLNCHKIMICFPRCMTVDTENFQIETLTQRYWEAMLSGCLILGHAPKELISVMGYNPVVEVDFNNAEEQILNIVSQIDSYQSLVDQNYKNALVYSPWTSRIELIKDKIQ